VHYNGVKVVEMYEQWFNFTSPFPIILNVHYGADFNDAFFDGVAANFGDGNDKNFPFVSLDLVSHEIAHGFTGLTSGLIIDGQSGGVAEAFSDMAGEAAEFFATGQNDWMFGWEVSKSDGALRYFKDPTKDGVSIDHASQYHDGMNVHYSAGVFNKAFYLLSTTPGWDVRKAFTVMLNANANFWVPTSDFVEAACGVIMSAKYLGFEYQDVYSAFSSVGVECDMAYGG
jgi:Zn-dependent metalloprotease